MAAKNLCEAPGWDAEQPGSPGENRQTLDYLFSATYEELRRLAATFRRDHPNATLNPTSLVNEAWLKLSKSSEFDTASPLHFKRIAARAILRNARSGRRAADKRQERVRVRPLAEERPGITARKRRT